MATSCRIARSRAGGTSSGDALVCCRELSDLAAQRADYQASARKIWV